jgi:hypothetical protein
MSKAVRAKLERLIRAAIEEAIRLQAWEPQRELAKALRVLLRLRK